MCDALMMDGIDISECRVETLFTDGATWYESERVTLVEEVEARLDGHRIPWQWKPPDDLFEFITRPAYYGA
jgi:hypothetical protein